MAKLDEIGPRIGLLGELEVEMQLVKNKWHPVRLDTAQMASNADLIAVNRKDRVSIQVKTTDADKQSDDALWLYFGHSTGYLSTKKTPIFNSKNSPLVADVVVGVCYSKNQSRFVVMPVAFAEKLCRYHCEYWYSVPTKNGASQRSSTFPIYLCFSAKREPHKAHYDRLKRNLLHFENAWHVLSEKVDDLHNEKKWPLLK